MLTYKYVARNTTGQKVTATVQADSEQSAAKLIKGQGLSPISITQVQDGNKGLARITNRVKTKDKILFSRQLATLINAGLPLLQSLRTVGEQTTNKGMKEVIDRIVSDIEAGKSLSEALVKHPKAFNEVFIGLVAAGETSGNLDKSLERLSLQQEKDAEITSKVKGAMVYPAIVLVVMMGIMTFMLTAVLPQVEQLYDGLPGAQLPLITRILLGISHAIVKYWHIILGLVGLGLYMTSRWVNHTPGGRQIFDKLKISLPPFGQLFMKVYMARFARTSASLVGSGVPLIQMLEITANSVNNVHVSGAITKAITKVKGGTALSDTLTGDPNFLPLVPNMLRIGEQSGSTEEMLAKTADYYEKEVDNQVKTISTIIEPVLMIILGIFAFIVVAAVLLPIYGLAGKNLSGS